MTDNHTTQDPFESLHSLEEQFHAEGYALGIADGSRAGKVEGRSFGMLKGYEKYEELGRISGRAAILQTRLQSTQASNAKDSSKLQPLPQNSKLQRHVEKLVSLTDHADLSTENSEDSVVEFDERLREAKSKALLIAKLTGDGSAHTTIKTDVEDFGKKV